MLPYLAGMIYFAVHESKIQRPTNPRAAAEGKGQSKMNISVFGLGYVGCVTAACLAEMGHKVIGVDVDAHKLSLIQSGRSPFYEPGLEALVRKNVTAFSLQVSGDAAVAIRESELVFICVGTPSKADGSTNPRYLKKVAAQIGRALKGHSESLVLALRSTLLPDLLEREFMVPVRQASGKVAGKGFDVAVNPEFLREGSAVKDFFDPPFVAVGSERREAGECVARAYKSFSAPVVQTDLRTACLLKYASNSFHGLKVAFANEIGILAKAYGVDSHVLLKLFVQDTKLNISPAYLKPGFAFGGSCLSKDLKALRAASRRMKVTLPLIEAVRQSNQLHLDRCAKMLAPFSRKKIGLVGLSFKADTDDIRESPAVALVQKLVRRKFKVKVYDRSFSPQSIYGSNRAFLERFLPNFSRLWVSELDTLLQQVDVIVLTQSLSEEQKEKVRQNARGRVVVDFARVFEPGELEAVEYRGICW